MVTPNPITPPIQLEERLSAEDEMEYRGLQFEGTPVPTEMGQGRRGRPVRGNVQKGGVRRQTERDANAPKTTYYYENGTERSNNRRIDSNAGAY